MLELVVLDFVGGWTDLVGAAIAGRRRGPDLDSEGCVGGVGGEAVTGSKGLGGAGGSTLLDGVVEIEGWTKVGWTVTGGTDERVGLDDNLE